MVAGSLVASPAAVEAPGSLGAVDDSADEDVGGGDVELVSLDGGAELEDELELDPLDDADVDAEAGGDDAEDDGPREIVEVVGRGVGLELDGTPRGFPGSTGGSVGRSPCRGGSGLVGSTGMVTPTAPLA